MSHIPPLSSFGRRIMICGPSNSGKSTLAVAIGRTLGVPAVHLDRLSHLPNTDWADRPEAEFNALHDDAIKGEAWVMDGNYSRHFRQRLARATGVILLVDNRWACLGRYLIRTVFQKERAGNIAGGMDSLKWEMVDWILVRTPSNLRRYRQQLPKAGLPYLETTGMRDVKALYAAWGLQS